MFRYAKACVLELVLELYCTCRLLRFDNDCNKEYYYFIIIVINLYHVLCYFTSKYSTVCLLTALCRTYCEGYALPDPLAVLVRGWKGR